MDPLSDILSRMKPRSHTYTGFDASGKWSFRFPAQEGIKFTAIMRGTCWGSVDGLTEPVQFNEGDCFLLNAGQPFVMATDPALTPIDGKLAFSTPPNGIAKLNHGGELFLVSGRLNFAGDHATLLFGALPSILHVPRATREAEVLRWSLDLLASELLRPAPGFTLMADHLTHIMLVQFLRLYLARSADSRSSWLFALGDRQIGAAITAIHSDLGHRWTLEELAHLAGMSRSAFVARFRELVGTTAIGYLTQWRMLEAADRLRADTESIAEIAFSIGYDSESAFSTAFKREMSCSPMQYRRKPSALPDIDVMKSGQDNFKIKVLEPESLGA